MIPSLNPYLPADKQNVANEPLWFDDESEVETNMEEVALLQERDFIDGLDDGEGPRGGDYES